MHHRVKERDGTKGLVGSFISYDQEIKDQRTRNKDYRTSSSSMEPNPPYLQHNHRYVPYSPNPSPTTLIPNSPSFYEPHHLPPPPPPPRPAPPPPLPPPPPPPNIPYQFTFRPNPYYPIEGPPHPRSTTNHHHPDVAHSSRLSYGVPVHDGRPYDPNRYQHSYADSDPSWDGRAYPVGILDPDPRPLQFDQRPVSPYRPIEKIRHDLEGDVRFRDGFQRNPPRGDFMRDLGDRNSHFHSSSRGWAEGGAAFSRAYEGKYDNRSHHRDSTENQNHRWPHNKEFVREGDGLQRVLGKHQYYSSELERHNNNNKGSREVNYEFDHTPKKQVQKKSALLRIQKPKPSYRNREDEVSHYSGYFNDTTSSSFRGVEQLKYTDHGVEENTRNGSPVELDVSFKSNSLVAKAIVPPLSSAVVTAKNLTPRNSKIRKLEVSEKDCSSSQVLKPSQSTVKLDGALCAGKITSTSNPVANFVIDNGHKSSSEPPSRKVDISLGKRKVERSAKVMSSGSSGKTNSTTVAKKKIFLKKVVKKVLNPWSRLSSSQPKEKLDGPMGTDTSTHCQLTTSVPENLTAPSGENTTPAGLVSVHHTACQPCPNYVSVCACDGVDGSPKTSTPEEVGGDSHCGGLTLQKFKSKWNDLTTCLDSKDKHIKFDESSTNADNFAHGLQTLSNTDKDCIELQSEKMSFFRAEGFSKQSCQNESSILLDGSPAVVSSEVKLSVGSGIEENMTQERLMNTSSGYHELNSAVVIDRSSIKSLERSVYADFENVESVSYQMGTCQIDKIDDDGTLEGFQQTVSSAGDMLALKILEETRIGDCKMATECSDQATSTIYSSRTRNSCFRSEEANLETGDDLGEQRYQGGITMFCESSAMVSSVDDTILAEVSEEHTPNNKREVRSPRLDLLRSGMNNLHVTPLNAVSSRLCVDTNLSSSFKEPVATISHGPSIKLGLQCCADGFGVTQGSSSIDGLLEAKISASNEVNVGLDEVSTKNEDDNIFSAGYIVPSSPITSAINEEPLVDSSTSLVEVPTETIESSIQPVEVVAVSSMDTVCTAGFSLCQEGITVGGSSTGVNSAGDNFVKDSRKFDGSNVYSYCTTENFGIANMKSICPSGLGWERVADVASAGSNHDMDIMSVENDEGEKTNLDAGDGQLMICGKSAQIRVPSECHYLAINQRSPQTELRDDSYLHHERELPSIFNYPSLLAHDNRVSTPNCNEEAMETVPEISEGCSSVLIDELDSTYGQIDVNNIGQDDTTLDKNSIIRGGSNVSIQTSHSMETKIDSKRNHVMEKNLSTNAKALPSQDSNITTPLRYPLSAESHGRKIHSIHAPPRIPGYSSFPYNASRITTSSTHVTQPRTWHRTTTSAPPISKNKPISSTVHPQRQLPRRSSKLLNNSYIRKGNSLVRKSPPVTHQSRGSLGLSSYVYQPNSLGTDEVKKNSGSESRVDDTDTSSSLGTGAASASFERPRTPPLPCITKILNRPTTSSGDHTSSPLAETYNVSNETTSLKFAESSDEPSAAKDLSKISEIPVYFTGSTNCVSSQNEFSDGNLTSLNAKSTTYVKKKSNQLIATSNTTGPCVHIADDTVASSSDGYYKRSRNQLIRTPLEGHAKQTAAMPDSAIISNGLPNSAVLAGRSFGRRQNQKVVTNAGKSSKFSLVWTLHGAQLSKKNVSSLKHLVRPHLPWKRVKYSRSFMQSPVSISNNSSLSTIRKLLMLRNRNTVYTRSRNGYSLRKFKVLSVGGCNLKWSKSIDRNSKKANEEATLAVAAVERKKTEQNGYVCTIPGTNNRNDSSRERIFRIGSLRYKMDSSRRTLQRISDNESSCSMALQTEKTMKRPYVPRRLMIGNDEYVRIGNGNQLIRNPKRRSRVLASEKVRWSLHTARSRLAKKRKYCQFFTRFGRCNKDDGKCPYIHDASKIAVCTKFLNGFCHNSNCKLTHKVIPERMPECSYFLQGLCTIKSCPYRHVHVNPNAPTCEGFLRGYCAEGNECRKKHSYICPSFEATGYCPLGSKCKLHHPKNRNKGKKGKRSIEQKNARGRYFGSMRILDASDGGKAAFEMQSVQDGDDVPLEGKFANFISIDDSDEDGECNEATTEPIASSGSGPSGLQTDDLDELIKPIVIMKKNLTSRSSPPVGGSQAQSVN